MATAKRDRDSKGGAKSSSGPESQDNNPIPLVDARSWPDCNRLSGPDRATLSQFGLWDFGLWARRD